MREEGVPAKKGGVTMREGGVQAKEGGVTIRGRGRNERMMHIRRHRHAAVLSSKRRRIRRSNRNTYVLISRRQHVIHRNTRNPDTYRYSSQRAAGLVESSAAPGGNFSHTERWN